MVQFCDYEVRNGTAHGAAQVTAEFGVRLTVATSLPYWRSGGDVADRELPHWRFFHVGACRNRALAPVKYFRGHRTLQQLIERV